MCNAFFLPEDIDPSEPSAEAVFLPAESIDQSELSATQFFLPEDIDQSEPSATEEVFLQAESIDQSEPSATDLFMAKTELFDLMAFSFPKAAIPVTDQKDRNLWGRE